MDNIPSTPRFKWTEQIDRHARILAGIGIPQSEIAARLNCNRATVRNHLGKYREFNPLCFEELLDLFERFDAERNLAEALTARSGSVEQARVRSSLRARRSVATSPPDNPIYQTHGDPSDDEICANLERLVGRPFTITD